MYKRALNVENMPRTDILEISLTSGMYCFPTSSHSYCTLGESGRRHCLKLYFMIWRKLIYVNP